MMSFQINPCHMMSVPRLVYAICSPCDMSSVPHVVHAMCRLYHALCLCHMLCVPYVVCCLGLMSHTISVPYAVCTIRCLCQPLYVPHVICAICCRCHIVARGYMLVAKVTRQGRHHKLIVTWTGQWCVVNDDRDHPHVVQNIVSGETRDAQVARMRFHCHAKLFYNEQFA